MLDLTRCLFSCWRTSVQKCILPPDKVLLTVSMSIRSDILWAKIRQWIFFFFYIWNGCLMQQLGSHAWISSTMWLYTSMHHYSGNFHSFLTRLILYMKWDRSRSCTATFYWKSILTVLLYRPLPLCLTPDGWFLCLYPIVFRVGARLCCRRWSTSIIVFLRYHWSQ